MSYVKLTSIQADASSQITSGRTRLYDLYILPGAGAGFVRLRDGGSSGNVLFEITTPASATAPMAIELPRYGIPFLTNLYIEASAITSTTLVFDGTLTPSLALASGGWLHLTDGAPLELAA